MLNKMLHHDKIKENLSFWGYDKESNICYKIRMIHDLFDKETFQLVKIIKDCDSSKDYEYLTKKHH